MAMENVASIMTSFVLKRFFAIKNTNRIANMEGTKEDNLKTVSELCSLDKNTLIEIYPSALGARLFPTSSLNQFVALTIFARHASSSQKEGLWYPRILRYTPNNMIKTIMR